MAYHITAANLLETGDVSAVAPVSAGLPVALNKELARVGRFRTSLILLPHIHLMDCNWQLNEDLLLENDTMGDTININFQLQGSMYSSFPQLDALEMNGYRHNLLFSPHPSRHRIPRNQELQMLHLSLNQGFFEQVVGCEDHWSEKALHKLRQQEPFRAADDLPVVTPVMQQLIHSIRNNQWQGSIRTLQLQSKVYELLALQFEQFKKEEPAITGLRTDDLERLYCLRQYLQQHFLEELSLTGLCRIAMLNEFKLKKGFRQLFGTTVFGYVKKLQMEYAGQLLKERHTVEEVAYTLGYEHAQHFSTSFRKFFGCSPSQYNK